MTREYREQKHGMDVEAEVRVASRCRSDESATIRKDLSSSLHVTGDRERNSTEKASQMFFPLRRKFGQSDRMEKARRRTKETTVYSKLLYTHRYLGAEEEVYIHTPYRARSSRMRGRTSHTHTHTHCESISISPAEILSTEVANVASSSDSMKPTSFNIIAEMGHPFSGDRRLRRSREIHRWFRSC